MSLDMDQLMGQYDQVKDDENKGSYLDNFVKMPEGKGSVVIRLLPPAPPQMFGRDKNEFYIWTRTHRVNNKTLHDPCEFVNGKWVGDNPIREYLRWLWKESEKAAPAEQDRMRKLYREIKPIDRYYFNCIVRSYTDDSGQVHENENKIFSCGKTLFQIILRGICGDKEMGIDKLGDVTDFKNGRDFKIVKAIKKSGDQTFPNYEQSHFVDVSPTGNPDECKQYMENLYDLHALRVLKSPEEMKHNLQVHLGVKQDNDTDFDPTEYSAMGSSDASSNASSVERGDNSDSAPVPQEEVASAPPESPVENPVSTDVADTSDEGESLADDDFLKELRDIG